MSSRKIPIVSVLIPVRDGSLYIRQAVESIKIQSIADWEMIIIDDGSTDETPRILRNLAAGDLRIRIASQPSKGLVAALNRGIALSRSPLIARMDADDVALANRLELQIAEFNRRPELVLLGGQTLHIDENCVEKGYGCYPIGNQACRNQLTRSSPFCHPSIMMRAKAVKKLRGYRGAYRHAEDYDLWLRLAEEGEIDNLDGVVLKYRLHKKSVTARYATEQAELSAMALVAAKARQQGLLDPTPAHGWMKADLPSMLKMIDATPSQRHHAELYYWRTLLLNGGLGDAVLMSTFHKKLSWLATLAKLLDEKHVYAFMMLRAAVFAMNNQSKLLALKCILRSIAITPIFTARELMARLVRPRPTVS